MSKGALVVRVWEDGSRRPVVGASVHLYGQKGLLSVGTTDAAGSVEFRDLDDGWVGARASAPGFANSDPQWQTVGEDATVAMHFALQPGVAVEGRVVARDGGAPVAGVRVVAVRGVLCTADLLPFAESTTDADGRFGISAVPRVERSMDATMLVLTHAEFATTDVLVRPAPADRGPIHVRVEMPSGAAIRGVVRDAKGGGVAGALIEAHRGNHSASMLPWSRGASWSSGPGGAGWIRRPRTTKPAVDGSFALAGLERGEDYTICANAKGHAPSAPEVVRADDAAASLDLRLRDTWSLNVRVVDVDGRAVADATLSVHGHDASCSPQQTGPSAWRVDDIGLLQASVFVQAAGYIHDFRHVERPTRRARSIRVVLKRTRYIAGVVVDDLGAPAAGARVWAEDSNLAIIDAGLDRAGEADADGRFRIEDRSSKRHRVFAQSALGDRGALHGVRPPADDVRVVVPRGVTVRTRLVPPAGAVLYAHSAKPARRRPRGERSDWRHGSALAVRDDVVVTGVPAGGAVLRLLVPGFQRIERGVVASPGEIVDLGTIDLEPEVELAGRVLDSGGRPVAGTVVSVDQPLRGDGTTPWDIHATTDDDGAFRLRGLWRGNVRVLVDTRRFLRPDFDVHVDGATPVTLTLPARSDENDLADELSRLP
jgi:protocatechuate 3,4-dioxygenase beta subunit